MTGIKNQAFRMLLQQFVKIFLKIFFVKFHKKGDFLARKGRFLPTKGGSGVFYEKIVVVSNIFILKSTSIDVNYRVHVSIIG
jgi:hypothetical protein